MPLPQSALEWDSFSRNIWLGDEVLTSQLCNISISVRQSWQMNPTLNITAWRRMKMTAMSCGCQICSCHCDGDLSFIICCACLCQLPLTLCIDLQEQRGAEVTLIRALQHGNHSQLTFHYLRQKGLKTKNMLRNFNAAYMTIINRGCWNGYCALETSVLSPWYYMLDLLALTISRWPCWISWSSSNQTFWCRPRKPVVGAI